MDVLHELETLRAKVKAEICKTLINIYVSQHGEMPNWEDEEEIIVDNIKHININVDIFDDYVDTYITEKQPITEYKVTLDEYLYFGTGEKSDYEIDWEDVNTDDLVRIYDNLKKLT